MHEKRSLLVFRLRTISTLVNRSIVDTFVLSRSSQFSGYEVAAPVAPVLSMIVCMYLYQYWYVLPLGGTSTGTINCMYYW